MKHDPQKISGYFFRTIGAISVSLGILCLLGGPDGRMGDIGSLKWAIGYIAIGLILVVVGKLIYKRIQ